MKKISTPIPLARLPKRYADLVALHMPRPIHDQVSYDNTVEIIDSLAGHKLNADQEDYLELLSHLVETYENDQLKTYPVSRGTELIKYLLKENNLTGDSLAELLNIDRSTAYKLLKGNRKLTTQHIRILTTRFKVSADLFLC